MRWFRCSFAAVLFSVAATTPAFADVARPAAAVPATFSPLQFLLGNWSGAGTSDAGAGKGYDTFALDLDGFAVVRRSHAEYPGKDGKAPVTYDALMVVYKDPAAAQLRADYFDNGHVIRYTLQSGTDARVARFVSDAAPGTPTFRLTYTGSDDGKSLDVTFEIAPPGSTTFSVLAAGRDTRIPAKE